VPKVLIQLKVNERTCMANQECVRAAPEIFELGAAGFARVVRNVSEADLARLRQVVDLCPTASIILEVAEELAP